MDKPTWSKVLSILLTAVIALAAVIGYDITIIQPRAAAPPLTRAAGDTNFTNVVAEDISANDDLSVGDDATITGDLTVTGALTLQGVAVSGPIRYGSASTVISGTTIAHGLATTPTVATLTAGIPITTPLYITARNATSITVGINDSVSVSTVFWIAGK